MPGNPLFIGEAISNERVRDTHITPFLGYKIATLVHKRGGVMFRGPHRRRLPYKQLDKSRCLYSFMPKHDFESCSCGFYGYTTIARAAQHWAEYSEGSASCAIIEVAFSGEVEVCEEGYRASLQRVTRIILPPCYICHTNAGSKMVQDTHTTFASVCESCLEQKTHHKSSASRFEDFVVANSTQGYPLIKLASASNVASYVTRGPNTLFYDDIHKEWKDLLRDPLMHSG